MIMGESFEKKRGRQNITPALYRVLFLFLECNFRFCSVFFFQCPISFHVIYIYINILDNSFGQLGVSPMIRQIHSNINIIYSTRRHIEPSKASIKLPYLFPP